MLDSSCESSPAQVLQQRRYAAEGAILAVWPSAAPDVRIWPDHATFTSDTSGSYRALTVAGVGSSALGAAAFARNVADAIGGPVLSVVSGYGLADLLTEALGGYFLFGHINLMRHVFETFDEVTRPSTALASNEVRIVRKSLDVRTLSALLSGEQHFDVLVGHSKGNLVISEALYALGETDPQALAYRGKETQVITISARVAMPRAMTRVTDVLGTLDGFGLLNSRLSIRTDEPVPLAWHHTNTELPFHLPVTATLEKILG
ncbi:hypothetical protein [Salipiger thiooxidans]|uniref:hypothetical protein n=1 Tax=Salipiger thiooxidans TaxID=282683 RepID=UPI001CD57F4C|nr:hypothetical protein [Salipiger thiooxidans]MCA0851568.1 hypothetical protein [Salipiger thiooxidans]